MAAAAKIAKIPTWSLWAQLSPDMNGKILGRLFHFAACSQLRLSAHTCGAMRWKEQWKAAARENSDHNLNFKNYIFPLCAVDAGATNAIMNVIMWKCGENFLAASCRIMKQIFDGDKEKVEKCLKNNSVSSNNSRKSLPFMSFSRCFVIACIARRKLFLNEIKFLRF